jgi:hypothetical protein
MCRIDVWASPNDPLAMEVVGFLTSSNVVPQNGAARPGLRKKRSPRWVRTFSMGANAKAGYQEAFGTIEPFGHSASELAHRDLTAWVKVHLTDTPVADEGATRWVHVLSRPIPVRVKRQPFFTFTKNPASLGIEGLPPADMYLILYYRPTEKKMGRLERERSDILQAHQSRCAAQQLAAMIGTTAGISPHCKDIPKTPMTALVA